MPGTVQELASMFRKAIDSQGNVLDMGVVKEVVAALERSPVSSKDLNDLKSTRLGKYINQVRRAIPDKSLAKRMKTLVIQWRSLAQQSPTTPNGVPTLPPPLPTSSTPSPAPPGTTHTATPAKLTTNAPPPTPLTQPSAPLSTNQQTSSQTLPVPHPPPPRPSSANPAVNRKRALHRLSKFPPQHPPQQKSFLATSSSSSSHHKTPSPTHSPLASSQTPPPAHSSTSKPTSIHPPTGKLPSSLTTKPQHIGEPLLASDGGPSSLQVRFPLHSVARSLVVRIPLERVSISRQPVITSDYSTLRTAGESSSNREGRPVAVADSHVAHTNGLNASIAEPSSSSPADTETTAVLTSTPSLALQPRERQGGKVTEPLSLIVSIDRDLLRKKADLRINLSPTPSQQDRLTTTDTTTDKTKVSADYNDSRSTPVKHTTPVTGSELAGGGEFGTDGVWRKWTDPIIHEDSFAVNVLPYVYVDGLEESEDESS